MKIYYLQVGDEIIYDDGVYNPSATDNTNTTIIQKEGEAHG